MGSTVVNKLYFKEVFLVSNPGSGVTLGKLPSLFGFGFRITLMGVLVTPSRWGFLALNEAVCEYVEGSLKSECVGSAKCLAHWILIREVSTLP